VLHRKVLGHPADGLAPAEPRNKYVTQPTPQRQPFLHGGEPIAAARLDKVGAINPALPTEVALHDAHVLSWARSSDYDLSCARLR